jgi:hypothetical protein
MLISRTLSGYGKSPFSLMYRENRRFSSFNSLMRPMIVEYRLLRLNNNNPTAEIPSAGARIAWIAWMAVTWVSGIFLFLSVPRMVVMYIISCKFKIDSSHTLESEKMVM